MQSARLTAFTWHMVGLPAWLTIPVMRRLHKHALTNNLHSTDSLDQTSGTAPNIATPCSLVWPASMPKQLPLVLHGKECVLYEEPCIAYAIMMVHEVRGLQLPGFPVAPVASAGEEPEPEPEEEESVPNALGRIGQDLGTSTWRCG